MKKEDSEHVRGLVAVEESRERRKQMRIPAIPGRFWLWTATILAAWAIFYWRTTQGEIESRKAKLLAQQRGVVAELGPNVLPLRDRIEAWVLGLAKPYTDDRITDEARALKFASVPGIYLRVRLADAGDVKTLRRASDDSLRDAFTGCLYQEPNVDPASGPPCKATRDCPKGTFCNEADHCVAPAQPYNMRAAYRGIRVLTEEWTVRLRTADNDKEMLLLEREYDTSVHDDIPLAIDLLTRAQYLMVVLDEAPEGKRTLPVEELQKLPHSARAALYNLKSDKDEPLLRIRRDVDATFVPAGESSPRDQRILDAQQRQVISCQFALLVKAALAAR
jgi:hypothetical protein